MKSMTLLTVCLAAMLGLYGCGDDSSSSSDDGPEATGAGPGSGSVNSVTLGRVFEVMASDRAVFESIQCAPPCTGMLSAEQASIVGKYKRDLRRELQSGAEVELAAGLTRYGDAIDVEVLHQEIERAGVTDEASADAWLSGLEMGLRDYMVRSAMVFVNAYARASQLPEPYKVMTKQRGGGGVVTVDVDAAGVVKELRKTLEYTVDTAKEYAYRDDRQITRFECVNWDIKFFDRICCGYICTPFLDEINEMCTVDSTMADRRWEEIDPDDCGALIVTPENETYMSEPQGREPEPADGR